MRKKVLRINAAAVILVLLLVVCIWFWLPPDLAELIKFDQNFSTGLSLVSITLDDLEEHNPPEQAEFDALKYNIDMELFPENESFRASTEITLVKLNPKTSSLPLNFSSELNLHSVKPAKFERSDDYLILSTVEFVDTFTIQVEYSGSPGRGILFGETENGKVVYSLNEPVFAPYWFPCIDSPADKAVYEFTIENDSGYVSVANGYLQKAQTSSGRSISTWKTDYPTATYLAAIYSARYSHFSEKSVLSPADTLALEYYVLPGKLDKAKSDFSINSEAISIFSNYFSEYPFKKEKYAVIEFLWNAGAIEHQTATGLGTNFISGKQLYTGLLVHELAHSWWGNSVSIKSWDDVWLNEGFASYCEALFWEAKSGPKALHSTMNSKFGEFFGERLFKPKSFLFSRTVYDKGAWVLHMLRKQTGDSLFFKIMRDFYDKFKYKNATTADFKRVAEEISGLDLSQFFDQWIVNGTGIIDVEYKIVVEENSGGFSTLLDLTQIQKGYDVYTFPLEIRISGKDNYKMFSERIHKKRSRITLFSDFKPEDVSLDPDGWLLAEFHKID